MDSLVSIIIPSFNKEKFIKQTIESVLSQIYKNIEIIVVDDCSTDNTLNILNKFKNNIILFVNKENKGACYCRNLGFKKSKGDFICLMDGDDCFSKNKLYFLDKLINKKKNFLQSR